MQILRIKRDDAAQATHGEFLAQPFAWDLEPEFGLEPPKIRPNERPAPRLQAQTARGDPRSRKHTLLASGRKRSIAREPLVERIASPAKMFRWMVGTRGEQARDGLELLLECVPRRQLPVERFGESTTSGRLLGRKCRPALVEASRSSRRSGRFVATEGRVSLFEEPREVDSRAGGLLDRFEELEHTLGVSRVCEITEPFERDGGAGESLSDIDRMLSNGRYDGAATNLRHRHGNGHETLGIRTRHVPRRPLKRSRQQFVRIA
jgi:hypothetical protein